MSVPRIVRSKYKFNAGSTKNLIVIKPEKCKINEQKQFLKLGLLNIRSLTPKAVIVNEMITDNSFDVLCLTETWLKPNDYIGLNESTPPSYCYKHEPVRLVVAAVSQQYIVIFSMLLRKQDTGLTHSKYFCLMLHCQICKINLSYLLLWLLCTARAIYRFPKRICRFPLRPTG